MVFAFSPDSRATLIKLRPRPAAGFAGSSTDKKSARELRGRARVRTPSSDRPTADLLKDWRNLRREEDKSAVPSRSWLVLEFAPTLFSASLLCKFRRGHSCNTSSFMHGPSVDLTHEPPQTTLIVRNGVSGDPGCGLVVCFGQPGKC